jgi:Fe-S-cluster containining protein
MKAFQCQMCGHCCYGEGGIFLEKREIKDIAGFLETPVASFLYRFCEEKLGRYQLKTGEDRFCIFFTKEKKCLINPVKPKRCRQWPFVPAIVRDKENWEMIKEACPGIHPDCSFDAFVRQSKEWT